MDRGQVLSSMHGGQIASMWRMKSIKITQNSHNTNRPKNNMQDGWMRCMFPKMTIITLEKQILLLMVPSIIGESQKMNHGDVQGLEFLGI